MKQNQMLTGRRALITGSGRGIGSAIALALAEAGADIALHYVADAKSVEDIAEQVRALGVDCTVAQANLSEKDGARGLMERAGGADILVLNASVQFRRPWMDVTDEEFDIQINCNLRASLSLIQQAVPRMRENRWGRIITIGSVQEAKPHPDMIVYAASKAAQTMMAKSLALQLAGDGITVNNVAPGVIYTDRNRDALADEAYAKQVAATIPLGYWGDKQDCAGIVRLLCTEEGRYITGQSIYVDGGKSL